MIYIFYMPIIYIVYEQLIIGSRGCRSSQAGWQRNIEAASFRLIREYYKLTKRFNLS